MNSQFKNYRSFKKALAYARASGITSDIEWRAKADNFPIDIPTNPDKVYKEWAGWGYWLGSSKKHPIFLSFKEARKIARSLNVQGRNAYKQLCKSGKKPDNIPSRPHLVYPMFKSYEDWTGKAERPNYRPYKEAKGFVNSLEIKDWPGWLKFAKSKKCPRDIPIYPEQVYGKGFSRSDWLGSKSEIRQRSNWRSFREARAYIRSLNLPGQKAYKELSSKRLRPKDIPAAPDRVYPEWISWGDWVGTGRIADQYKKSKHFAGKLHIK